MAKVPLTVVAGPFHDTGTHGYTERDFRFTTKGGTLYALQLGWPRDQKAVIQSLGANGIGGKQKVLSVGLLGSDEKLQFEQQAGGLHIRVPAKAPG